MFDRRHLAYIAAALLVACVATMGAWRLVVPSDADRTRAVVVLTRAVRAGETLDSTALGVKQWPLPAVPPDAYAERDSLVGRVMAQGLDAGAVVRAAALAKRGVSARLEGDIAPGRRAMAIRVSDAAGQSALVQPNSHVDVLVVVRDATADAPPMARLAIRDVRVLGVGDARVERVGGPETPNGQPLPTSSIVTLEVTPAQAELLAVAETQGVIQLVLRGWKGTDDSSVTRGARIGDVLGTADAAVGRRAGGAAAGYCCIPMGALARGVPMPTPAPGAAYGGGAAAGPTLAGATNGEGIPVAPQWQRRAGLRVSTGEPVRPAPGATPQPAPSAAPRAASAPVVAAPAGAGDTLVVRIYRGGQETVQRVEAGVAPAGAAPSAARP